MYMWGGEQRGRRPAIRKPRENFTFALAHRSYIYFLPSFFAFPFFYPLVLCPGFSRAPTHFTHTHTHTRISSYRIFIYTRITRQLLRQRIHPLLVRLTPYYIYIYKLVGPAIFRIFSSLSLSYSLSLSRHHVV